MEMDLAHVILDLMVLLVMYVLLDLQEIIVILIVITVILWVAITFVLELEMDLAHVKLDITVLCANLVANSTALLQASVQKGKLEIVPPTTVDLILLATVVTVLAHTTDLLAYSVLHVKIKENVSKGKQEMDLAIALVDLKETYVTQQFYLHKHLRMHLIIFLHPLDYL